MGGKTTVIAELISRRRRQLLVHSCLYYRMGTSIWSDAQFDSYGRELVKLQADHPDLAAECEWAKEFEDWDATTGFHLCLDDPWVCAKAMHLLDLYKQFGGEQFD